MLGQSELARDVVRAWGIDGVRDSRTVLTKQHYVELYGRHNVEHIHARNVTDDEALVEVKRLVGGNQLRLSYHAEFERMPLRGATFADIKAGLVSATSATWQADRANWKIAGGVDTDDDEITIIVDIDDGVLVVTLF